MRRRNKLNENTLKSMRNQAEKIKIMQIKIEELENKLYKMKEENNWVHYLGSEFYEGASEEQKMEFFKLVKIIESIE